jgi:hypothetical protein
VTPKVQHFYHTFIDKSLFVYIYWHSGNAKNLFVVGFAAPFSHFETTFAVTPSFPISSSYVSFAAFL